MMSISKFDVAFMKMARAMSSLSHDPDTQVGCVLVKDKFVIASGYNGTPRGTDNSMKSSSGNTLPVVIHAEMNALMYAARSNQSTVGSVAYTTLYPCLKCLIHLYQAGIKEIVYSDSTGHPDQDAAGRWIAETSTIKIRRVSDESNREDTRVSKRKRYKKP